MMRSDANPLSGIPPVVKNLLIINIAMYVLKIIGPMNMSQMDMDHLFGLHLIGSPLFKPWQLITHMFMHGSTWHLLGNMLGLYMLGARIEYRWGSQRFLVYYLVCGLGAALIYMGWQWFQIKDFLAMLTSAELEQVREMVLTNDLRGIEEAMVPGMTDVGAAWWIPMVGASGAIFGILIAFGMIYPNVELTVLLGFFPVPMKAKWFVILYGAFTLYMGIANNPGDNVAHFAHLGGMLVGFFLVRYWEKKHQHFY
jgi:membrane associated rhomboid family serine protease